MTMRFIQGFEHIVPTPDATQGVDQNEVRQYLGFLTPTNNVSDWFKNAAGGYDDTSGFVIDDSEYNIDGQSLAIKRPDAGETNNPLFNGKYSVELARSVLTQTKTIMGFAIKLSARPTVALPLAQFRASNGTTDDEQASLWVSRTGQLFFSSVDFDITSEVVITPAAIGALVSGEQVFNFDQWNYIEITLNTATAPATITLSVDNVAVIDGVQDVGANKSTLANTTQMSIINAHNLYFDDSAYTMWLDDIYFADGNGSGITSATGPQHIVLLKPDSTTQNEWVISGGAATSYEAVGSKFNPTDLTDYITNDAATDEEIFTLADTPASVVGITAVQLGAFMNVDAGSAVIALKLVEGGDESAQEVTVNTTAINFYSVIFENDAGGDNWTATTLDATSIAAEVTT